MTPRILIALALAACVGQPSTSAISSATGPNATDCMVAAAIPNDGLDDRAAIQAALDSQHCADLGPGVYDVSVNPVPGVVGMASIALGANETIRGAGPATVLAFYGDAFNDDWRGIRLEGPDASVSDLYLDSSDLTNTEEQTHMIEVIALNAGLHNLWINHPTRTGQAGGDCVRLLGEEAAPVSATITGNTFVECDRSGVAVQRATYGLTITGNVFRLTGDQDIDAEMTGSGIGGDWSIVGNSFLDPLDRGGLAVAFAGTVAKRIAFAGNVLSGRGLNLYNVLKGTITGNIIEQRGPGLPVTITKANEEIIFANNVVNKTYADTSSLVSVSALNTGNPGRLVFTGNHFTSVSTGTLVLVNSASAVTFTGNTLDGVTGTGTAFAAQGISRQTETAQVLGNRFRGPFTQCVHLNNVASSTVIGNVGINPGGTVPKGVNCYALVQLVTQGNLWGLHSNCSSFVVAGN